MWRVLCVALAVVVTSSGAQGSSRPPIGKCGYYSGEELEYDCPLSDGNRVIIKVQPNEYVKINCQGGTLKCDDIPEVGVSRDGTLKSMSVSDCALSDPLPRVLEALGARDVTTLSLWNLRTPLTPDHVRGFNNIFALMMFESGVEQSVPMDVLSSLPSLRHYRLREARGVSLREFPALPLRYLELSMDGIQELPPNVFQHLDNLTALHLWGNKYQQVSNQSFTGLRSLESLSLSSSTRSLAPGTFLPAPRLKEIYLTRVNLHTLHQGVFTGLQYLEKISMSNDIHLTVEQQAFAALPSLTELKLDMSTIHSLPPDAFSGSSALANLSLANNVLEALPSVLFKDQTALRRLHLQRNHIKALPADLFAANKKLVELNLDGNYIEVLPSLLFAGLAELQTVSINNNRLKTIVDYAFQGARTLHTLKLSNNQLTLQPESNAIATTNETNEYSYENMIIQSPFSYLLELRELDLSRNNISYIFDDWMTTLVQLQRLDLTYNRFNSINSYDIAFLSLHLVVDLRHNNISTVNLNHLHPEDLARTSIGSYGEALLEDNPLHCDCHLYGVVQRLHNTFDSQISEVKLNFGEAACVAPRNLAGTPVTSLKPEQLICNITTDCPGGCQCDHRPATDTLELVCDTGDVIIPQPGNFHVKSMQLQLRSIPAYFHILPSYVQVLKLNGLGMDKIPEGRPVDSVKEIDLRNNSLRDVPAELIKMNLQLSLSGNKFDCDCAHARELALLIQYKDNIKDFYDVTCSDGVSVSSLDTKRLCTQLIATVVGGTLALIGVLVAVLAVLIYRYSLEVRVWLFARGWCRCLLPEEQLDRDKEYDVFLSYAHGDEKYVREELLPTLDEEYRVCVHYRDWIVGDMIPTQIARSVESSRRTIIVLSHKFLDSIWASLEFRAAHMQAVSDRRARVIVVLLQDVTNHEKLDDEMKAYLNTNTYVKWGDPWFWDKLRYVLPRRSANQRVEEMRAARRTREALDKFASYGLDVHINEEGKLVNAAIKA